MSLIDREAASQKILDMGKKLQEPLKSHSTLLAMCVKDDKKTFPEIQAVELKIIKEIYRDIEGQYEEEVDCDGVSSLGKALNTMRNYIPGIDE